MDSGRRSGNFRGVKITLIVFQSLALIGAIALTILSIVSVGLVNSNPEKFPNTDLSYLSKY
jgi:hypothetical protein